MEDNQFFLFSKSMPVEKKGQSDHDSVPGVLRGCLKIMFLLQNRQKWSGFPECRTTRNSR